jgi:hypothetical protein
LGQRHRAPVPPGNTGTLKSAIVALFDAARDRCANLAGEVVTLVGALPLIEDQPLPNVPVDFAWPSEFEGAADHPPGQQGHPPSATTAASKMNRDRSSLSSMWQTKIPN